MGQPANSLDMAVVVLPFLCDHDGLSGAGGWVRGNHCVVKNAFSGVVG